MISNTTSNHHFLRVALLLQSLSLLVGLGVFAYLGTFSRYGADDYCFSRRLMQTDNLIEATIVWYMNTSNRYTTMLLVGMSEWFGSSAIRYLPALAILLWVGGLSWMMSRLSAKLRLPYPFLSGFVLSALIAFFSILQAPNRYQSLYWRSGMVTYFTPLIAFALLAGLILVEIWREKPRSKPAWIAILTLIWLGFFLAGGLSETTLAIQGGALGLSIIAVWFLTRGRQREKALSLLLTGLVASILVLVVIFLAPANALRVRAFGPSPPIMEVLQFSLIFAWDFMRETFKSLPTPTFVSLCTAALLGFSLYTSETPLLQRKTLVLSLIAIAFITHLLIFFSMTPSVYGQNSYPGARALMATRAVMVTGLMMFGFLIGALSCSVISHLSIHGRLLHWAVSMGLFLLILISVYPIYSADRTLDLLPWYRTRAEQWDIRDAQIRQAVVEGATDLVVVQLDTIGGVQEYKGREVNWVNRCAAEYYGLNSLRAP
jgi:hypothetical protein